MKPLSLQLAGFRTFPDPTTFTFPVDAGVYFITGENLDEPQLEANGTGKTTLFESLPYCLFGRTSCGEKGPDVASWVESASPTRVGFSYTTGPTRIPTEVTRGYQPNVLLLQTGDQVGPRRVEQPAIDEHVGMSREQFLAVVLFSQFGTGFMDLKPAGQLSAFSAALHLDIWEEYGKRAADKVKALRKELEPAAADLDRTKGHMEGARQTYNARADEADSWDAAELVGLEQVGSRRAELQAQRPRLQDAVDGARLDRGEAISAELRDLDAHTTAAEAWETAIAHTWVPRLAAARARVTTQVAQARDDWKTASAAVDALRATQDADQARRASTHAEELKAQTEELTAARARLQGARGDLATTRGTVDHTAADLQRVTTALSQAEHELDTADDGANCQACGQPLPAESRATVLARLRTALDTCTRDQGAALDAHDQAKARLATRTRACEDLAPEVQTIEAAVQASTQVNQETESDLRATEVAALQELTTHMRTAADTLGTIEARACAEHLTPVQAERDQDRKTTELQARQAQASLDQARAWVSDATDKARVAKADIEALDQELETVNAPRPANPHVEPLKNLGDLVDQATDAKAKAQATVDDLELRIDRFGYWVSAFPRLRLWLLQSAAIEFQALFQNNLGPLGLVGWSVACQTTRELKSGNTRAELTTLVTKVGRDRPAPVRAYSGGEQQRIKIAGQAAFADVVRARMPNPPEFEMWDEPTGPLSAQGCDDVMTWFRERARTRNRQVWVIDHRTQYAGEVDMHLRFIKEDGATRIIDDR